MLIPLGILSAAGGGVVGGNYDLIETTILGSAASSVTFSSLATYASTYKHLQIRYVGRTNRADDNAQPVIRFNADSGSNYDYHGLEGWNNAVNSVATINASGMNLGYSFSGTSSGTNVFGAGVVDILDAYSTTKNKTIRALNGQSSDARKFVHLNSGLWRNTPQQLPVLNCNQSVLRVLLLAHASRSTESRAKLPKEMRK